MVDHDSSRLREDDRLIIRASLPRRNELLSLRNARGGGKMLPPEYQQRKITSYKYNFIKPQQQQRWRLVAVVVGAPKVDAAVHAERIAMAPRMPVCAVLRLAFAVAAVVARAEASARACGGALFLRSTPVFRLGEITARTKSSAKANQAPSNGSYSRGQQNDGDVSLRVLRRLIFWELYFFFLYIYT